MPSRHRSRERALQVLYQVDIAVEPLDAAISSFCSIHCPGEQDPFMEELVRGATARRAEIDELIQKHSQNWRLDRMSVVDRNILRLAVFEMRHAGTPAPIVIDEAIELARRFSGDESIAFINGLLDALRIAAAATPPPSSHTDAV